LDRPTPDPAGPGQESVWDFPRPAVAEACKSEIKVKYGGKMIASTTKAVRTLETSHPPTYYIPQEDIDMSCLRRTNGGGSFCEWKGSAIYYDVVVDGKVADGAAWSYPNPTEPFKSIKDHVAFYANRMECCYVDGEEVTPQPGNFYGGWITSKMAGPFKGIPGSQFW